MSELDRTVGQLEAGLKAMSDKIDHILKVVDNIDERLKAIEARENERKGAFRLAIFLAGVIGAASVKLLTYFVQFIK
jgi:septal ring factor EnvC (AmiA/AmiB activator)